MEKQKIQMILKTVSKALMIMKENKSKEKMMMYKNHRMVESRSIKFKIRLMISLIKIKMKKNL